VTAPAQHRPNSDLLDELRSAAASRPRWRLHVHPDSAMWISISVQGTGLGEHVRVVPDPSCPELGKGWIETLTTEQWAGLLALVGQQVIVTTSGLGVLSGELLALNDREARVDLGDADIRYLPWITVEPANGKAAPE
jgi:hypothetical protein